MQQVVPLGATVDNTPAPIRTGALFEPFRSTDGKQHVLPYYWDTVGLQYVVATTGGTGVGTEVEVTNWPSTQTVSESRSSSATLANVAGSASSVTLIASNSGRKAFSLYNDSTAALYVKYGSAASTSSFTVKVFPNGFYSDNAYTGIITGIWDSATGNARTTELT